MLELGDRYSITKVADLLTESWLREHLPNGPIGILKYNSVLAAIVPHDNGYADHPLGEKHTIIKVLSIANELGREAKRCGDTQGADALAYFIDTIKERLLGAG